MYKENFTAILPVTCNANCSFCPEKEMERKASKEEWLQNFADTLVKTRFLHDHISLSGGEPTLDLRLLAKTIRVICENEGRGVGITTNGQFLESLTKVSGFINACTVNGEFAPYFINISRHAFSTEENNRLMKVNYRHTMDDIFSFREMLPKHVSFRLNMVLVKGEDHLALFKEAASYFARLREARIAISFRTDYSLVTSKEQGLIPHAIYDQFVSVFGPCEETYSCPTCVTHVPRAAPYYILKAGDFEPTDKEAIQREFVFHQDGKLYHDWKRNKPVDLEQLTIDREEALLRRVEAGDTAPVLLGRAPLSWLSVAGLKRLNIALEKANELSRKWSETPRETCGSSGCGSLGDVGGYDYEFAGEAGCGGTPTYSPPSCGGGRSGSTCGGSPRRPERSQSNCGGVNAFPKKD